MFWLILLLIIDIPIFIYLVVIAHYHDLHLPSLDLKKYRNKKVLIFYPHPDDETIAAGGLIRRLSKQGTFVHVASLTKGEKGNELLPNLTETELGEQRVKEFENAVARLGGKSFEVFNLGDSNLKNHIEAIRKTLDTLVKKHQINLIVTFERTGMYGHMDHVVASSVVNEYVQLNPEIQTLYSTLPAKIEKKANMKAHMRDDVELEQYELNEKPEYKLSIWTSIFAKYKAAKAHKSQKLSHGRPLWVSMLAMPYEYYTTIYDRGVAVGTQVSAIRK